MRAYRVIKKWNHYSNGHINQVPHSCFGMYWIKTWTMELVSDTVVGAVWSGMNKGSALPLAVTDDYSFFFLFLFFCIRLSITVDDYESAHVRMESAWRVHGECMHCALLYRCVCDCVCSARTSAVFFCFFFTHNSPLTNCYDKWWLTWILGQADFHFDRGSGCRL